MYTERYHRLLQICHELNKVCKYLGVSPVQVECPLDDDLIRDWNVLRKTEFPRVYVTQNQGYAISKSLCKHISPRQDYSQSRNLHQEHMKRLASYSPETRLLLFDEPATTVVPFHIFLSALIHQLRDHMTVQLEKRYSNLSLLQRQTEYYVDVATTLLMPTLTLVVGLQELHFANPTLDHVFLFRLQLFVLHCVLRNATFRWLLPPADASASMSSSSPVETLRYFDMHDSCDRRKTPLEAIVPAITFSNKQIVPGLMIRQPRSFLVELEPDFVSNDAVHVSGILLEFRRIAGHPSPEDNCVLRINYTMDDKINERKLFIIRNSSFLVYLHPTSLRADADGIWLHVHDDTHDFLLCPPHTRRLRLSDLFSRLCLCKAGDPS